MRLLDYWIGLMVIIFGLTACEHSGRRLSYELSVQETHEMILEKSYEVDPAKVETILERQHPAYQLLDIRPAANFELGHLDGAINIPVQNILEEETLALLSDSTMTFILYGADQAEANGPWILLRQLGYDNVKILQGGYGHLSLLSDSTTTLQAEAPKYDFAALLEEAALKYAEELEAGKPKPALNTRAPAPKTIVPKKKKKQVVEEEGC